MSDTLTNIHDLVGRCPFATSQKVLAGKWVLLILHELAEGPVRFRELERRLNPITQATLTRALRQMEHDGLISRKVYAEMGAEFRTVLTALESWGLKYIEFMKESGRI